MTPLPRAGLGREADHGAARSDAGEGRADPAGDHPYLLLGGTGVLPLRDAEDRHVLEVAVAGHADVLATANLGDFTGANFEPLGNWTRALLYKPLAAPPLVIAHPDHVATWLRSGIVPSP